MVKELFVTVQQTIERTGKIVPNDGINVDALKEMVDAGEFPEIESALENGGEVTELVVEYVDAADEVMGRIEWGFIDTDDTHYTTEQVEFERAFTEGK